MERPRILVPLANGFEEIEAVTIIDILRRAGAWVSVAGQNDRTVTGSHGITVIADAILADAANDQWDWIILPGGTQGVENLMYDEYLSLILENHRRRNAPLGAICAAPSILDAKQFVNGETITVHPAVASVIKSAVIKNEAVVETDKLITGRSAGAAMNFAFALVRRIFGDDVANEVNKGVIADLK